VKQKTIDRLLKRGEERKREETQTENPKPKITP